MLLNLVLYPARNGAYTELYAGLSPDITLENNGAYILPFGRIREDAANGRKDINESMRPEEEGGKGLPKKFWEWCQEKIKQFT